MTSSHARLTRESKTVEAMIGLYCRGQHDTQPALCEECETLRGYAQQRLERCPFQEGKTTCAKCPIHCYEPDMRAQIRAVMRYAGPRMLCRHPILTLRHMIDGLRSEPFPPRKKRTILTSPVRKPRT
jgi:hypothetical protein